MKISLELLGKFCNLVKIAQKIHKDAVPLKTLQCPRHYEIPASQLKELGDTLQELGENIALTELKKGD